MAARNKCSFLLRKLNIPIVGVNHCIAHLEVGKLIAKKSQEKKIEEVVFDRGGYKYHGRVKSLADGAREGGLKF